MFETPPLQVLHFPARRCTMNFSTTSVFRCHGFVTAGARFLEKRSCGQQYIPAAADALAPSSPWPPSEDKIRKEEKSPTSVPATARHDTPMIQQKQWGKQTHRKRDYCVMRGCFHGHCQSPGKNTGALHTQSVQKPQGHGVVDVTNGNPTRKKEEGGKKATDCFFDCLPKLCSPPDPATRGHMIVA